MSVGKVALVDSEYDEHDETVTMLEEAYGTCFGVWTSSGGDEWLAAERGEGGEFSSDHCLEQLQALLAEAYDLKEPRALELPRGEQLLAVPLSDSNSEVRKCAVSVVEANSAELLLQLAKSKLRELEQEDDIKLLKQENEFFLKQVCDDFEELTFLRSMAEQLTLEDDANDVAGLIEYLMPQLGETASVEELYFLDGGMEDAPRVKQRWLSNPDFANRFEPRDLEQLVVQYSHKALERPVVLNGLIESDLHPELPALNEFVLVAVSTAIGPIGWFLGVNKVQQACAAGDEPYWQQSLVEFGTSEASLIHTAAAMLASHTHNISFLAERERMLVSVVRTLVSAVESKDAYTCGHSERVALYGKCLAAAAGYGAEASERLYLTGLLHDIGKIGVSDAVLKKEGSLTDEEFAEIQRHPDIGWAILRELTHLNYVLPGVLHHHERVDGKGYPDQLAGGAIPRDGQLLAVVDAFDAMTSDRPYRKGMSVERAVEIFKQGAGTQWNTELVDLFLEILPEIVAIKEGYQRPPLPQRVKCQGGCQIEQSGHQPANCQLACTVS
ncbi:MAG: HD-GYP domain-containing protein [Planctomycetales bacterium]|nr:HD-GYP domain-containing protein [Planctomycetales bacterium]